ncbi:cytochrome c oxidase subunit II [Methylocystis sp. MJC1]|uniref:cytochrome c oxidase subunit II n=1 Tax=Methylocystis sp. MJC1 TaxID=2654282 RepID=UPI0013EDD3E6|nr:cytochrome c oxidase subunit II [Methylocystis sp. MJC1]KAF2989877.1 cytochrome c oxidase subunit 2 [Methylocystis sp. MJC1]MBU6528354.1 cytochrome c oxidase subunit II [Methylocystis sp. MJC1]UZX11259.1 cytochrome c oxidase subunit II [Methylocystis sp. MJC1]
MIPQATKDSVEVDYLIGALVLASVAILALVYGLILLYMFRYHAGSKAERGRPSRKSWRFEIAWTAATMAAFFGLFLWGADLYVRLFQAPANALQIYVVGKQWIWKVEHPGGQKEINALHLPIGRPIQLVMTSQDVIHDFSVPAFRIKRDVLPGRYETIWFEAQRPGSYHLFCTQLCGAGHATMTGEVVAMSAPDFEKWLSQGPAPTGARESMAAEGQVLFMRLGCSGCHGAKGEGSGGAVKAPALVGLYGSQVKLSTGAVVKSDDRYLRDSILQPDKEIVAGYEPIMPSFSGQVDEEQLMRLIAYLKSLKAKEKP